MKINIPISVGELVDKITILEIKSIMINNKFKLTEVKNEKVQLTEEFQKICDVNFSKSQLFALKADLYETNLRLWYIEDNIRKSERNNDARFGLKNNINQLTNSDIKEVKSYESYS